MALIRWTAGDRELPGIGLVKSGSEFEVSEDVAESFIKSGRAVEVLGQGVPDIEAGPASVGIEDEENNNNGIDKPESEEE